MTSTQFEPEMNNFAHQATAAQPFYDFAVDDLLPKCQTLWWFKRSARTMLHLTNKSNGTAAFQLTGQGETAGCQIEFERPSGAAGPASLPELKLTAGQTISVPVRVRLPFPPAIAFRRQKYYFTVTSTLSTGCRQRRQLLGQVTVRPIVGPGLMLLIVAGWVMWAAFAPHPAMQSAPGLESDVAEIDPGIAGAPANLFVMPVYQAGNSPQAPFEAGAAAASAMTYRQMFEDVARKYNLDWRLLAEIAWQESRYNSWAIGRSQEMGLMQIHPVTWGVWAPRVGVTDPYDPYSNIQVAAAFLAYLTNFCQSRGYADPRCVLIGYNWGPSNLQKLFRENGTLEQVPEKPRQYAMRILQLEPGTPIRRQAQLETLVTPVVASVQ